jgi:hypothetical protein
MSNQTINIGSQPNDGTGDSIYTAFQKVNANFQEVYTLLGYGAGFSFLRLKEAPTFLRPNAILQVNSVGTKFINKTLVASTGMQINITTSTIEFVNTASSLRNDSNPTLSANLSGEFAFSLINMDAAGPHADRDAVSRKWVYENFLQRDGTVIYDTTSSFELPYAGRSVLRENVRSVATATNVLDLTNKKYVDNLVETSSFVSSVNFFVTTVGDDNRFNVASSKRGRATAYAFKTINRAAEAAEQFIAASQIVLGPYQKTISYGQGTGNAVIASTTSSPILSASTFATRIKVSLPVEYFNVGTDPYINKSIFPGNYIIGSRSEAVGLIESVILNSGTGEEFYDVTPVDYAKTYNVRATPNTQGPEVTFSLGIGRVIDIPDFWLGYRFVVTDSSYAVVADGVITSINTTIDDSNNVIDTITVDFGTGLLPNTNAIDADKWHVYSAYFEVGEELQWGQKQNKNQCTIIVESGEHEDDYPIKVPENCSIRGDEFRRSVIKPKPLFGTRLPGISSSKWANTYFFRDAQIDGIIVNQLNTATNFASAVGITADAINNDGTTDVVTFTLASGTAPSSWVGKIFKTSALYDAQGEIRSVNGNIFTVSLAQNSKYDKAIENYVVGTTVIPSGAWYVYTPIKNGYHYLRDSSRKVNTLTTQTNGGGLNNTAVALELNREFIQKECIAYLQYTYTSGGFIWANQSDTTKSKCERDIGIIVDALVTDLRSGGNNYTINAGDSYRNVAVVKNLQLGPTVAAIDHIWDIGRLIVNNEDVTALQTTVDQVKTGLPLETNGREILRDLVQACSRIVNNDPLFNPPKYNDQMDVFLMNDATINRYISCQGHGGFMKVLDPDGQILAKSPYTQTASSFSKSYNRQVFSGGMFIDGFAGNIDVNLTSGTITNDSQGNPVKINVTAAGGLGRPSITGDGTYIRPQVPCFFVHRGVTYEVSFIGEWNPTLGKGSLNLNPLRPGGIGSVTPITTNIATGFKTGGGTLTVPVRFSTPTQTGGLSANGTAVINNSGNVTSVTVSFPGSGYSNGAYTNATEGCPTIIIGGARLTWIRDNGGGITGYSIIDAGTGYAVNTIINFPNTSGGVATAYVSSVDANGGITGVTISSPGTGYTEDPVVTFGDNLLYNLTVKPGFTVTSGHPLPSSVTLITAGNRSMLANDFTQMNDLGYGIFCTNGGLVENVSMFTYYCHSAYYSLNGGQCRSIAGSTSYGVNGLKSEGSDPNEVPIAIRNKRAMTQKVSVYSQGDYINAIDDFSIYVTLDTGGYTPLAQSQIEINHYGVVKNYNVQSAILVDDPAVPANTYALTVDDGTGQGLIAAVPDAWPAIIRIYFVQELLDINKDTLSRPSTVLSFYEDPTNVYNILAYTQTGADSATAESDEPYNYILLEPYTESGLFRQGLGRFTVTGGGTGFNTNTNYTATIPAPSTAGTATVNGNQTNTDLVTISSPANTILPGSRVTLTAGGGDPSGIVGANTYVLWVNSAKTQIRVSRKTSWTNGAGLTFSGTQAVGYARCNNLSGTIDQLVLTNQGAGYDGTSVRTITVAGGTSPATITAYPVGVVGSNKIKVIDISPADRARIVAGLAATTPYYYYFVWEGVTYKVTGYSGATQTGNEWGEVTVETIAGAAIQAPVISSTLKAGVGANTQGDVTVRISTMRVTGHDMLNVGTGGYADSKYPNDLYGPPINPPDSGLETKELRKGRVYYATTDQDGNFKVGKSFSVDQGRGTVSISAPISLTNVDGISFKRGQTLVQQFTVDGTMGGNSNNSVPTERAIITYVNNRLGLNKNNNQSGVTKIGSGFMDLIGFQSMNGPLKTKIVVPTDSGAYWVGTATNFYTEMHAVRFFGTATTALTWNTPRSVTFSGDVTGTFSMNGGADVTGVTMTIQPNSVELGTDTTGNYVATGATTGFGLSGSTSGENQTFTVNSNATSTNTVNTIVHRNGDGDFTARVVNANTFSGTTAIISGTYNNITPDNKFFYTTASTTGAVLAIRGTGNSQNSNTSRYPVIGLGVSTVIQKIQVGNPSSDAGETALRSILNAVNPGTGLAYGNISGSGGIDLADSISILKYIVGLSIPTAEKTRITTLISQINSSADKALIAGYGHIAAGSNLTSLGANAILRTIAGSTPSSVAESTFFELLNTVNPDTTFKYGDITGSGGLDSVDHTRVTEFINGTAISDDEFQRIQFLLTKINASPYKNLWQTWGYITGDGVDDITLTEGTNISISTNGNKGIIIDGSTDPTINSITRDGTDGVGDIGEAGNRFNAIYANNIYGSVTGSATKTTNTLTVGTYLSFASGSGFDGSANRQILTNATALNTAETIVARDTVGNFATSSINGIYPENIFAYTTATINGTSGALLRITGTGSSQKTKPTRITLNSKFATVFSKIVVGSPVSDPGETALRAILSTVNPSSSPAGLYYGDVSGTGGTYPGCIDLADQIAVQKYIVGQSISSGEQTRINQLITALETSANRQLMVDYGWIDAGVSFNANTATPITRQIVSLPMLDPGQQALLEIMDTVNPNTTWRYGDLNGSGGALDLNDYTTILQFVAGLITDDNVLARIRRLMVQINASPYKELIESYGYIGSDGRDDITFKSGTNITVSASGVKEITVTGSSTPTFSSITKGGTDGVGDIGEAGNKFANVYGTTFYGVATSAQYADLAERYKADANYDPGTVVSFGGAEEITVAREFMDRRIAGVISTNPAYLMNDREGAGLAVALQGRVPCKVVGKIRKGDMLVASGMVPGVATAEEHPALGSVIGKALENYDSQTIGLIEVVVGRI